MPLERCDASRQAPLPQNFKSSSKTNTLSQLANPRQLLSCRLLRPPLDVDLALQVSAFFDRNPLSRNIPVQHGRLPQFHSVAGLDVALEFALHNDDFRLDGSLDLAVWSDRKTITLQRDTALHLTIDVKIFAAGQFALDDHRFADLRQVCRQRSTHGCSPWERDAALTS